MDGPGFAGWLEAGERPEVAWARIRAACQTAEGLAVVQELERTDHGRQALAWSRVRWSAYGLPAPWERRADTRQRRAGE